MRPGFDNILSMIDISDYVLNHTGWDWSALILVR
jgi:hypothetical protein